MPKLATHSLTVAFCRSARPGLSETAAGATAVQTDYPDLDVRGLALRVSPGGQKSWTYRYRDQLTGKQSRLTLGAFDAHSDGEPDENGVRPLTLHSARMAARQLRAQVDAGRNPAVEKRRRREQARAYEIKTMADLAEAYFKACEMGVHRGGKRRKKADSTLAGERWLWGRYVARRLGGDAVETVSKTQVRGLLRDVLGEAPSQSNKVRSLLSQLFNFAIAEERLTVNPAALVAKMGEDGARTRTLSDAEVLTVWRGLRQPAGLQISRGAHAEKLFIGPAVRLALELAMFTLQRRAEISGMRRSELDLERGTWVIGAARTKGRTEHLVPLSRHAVTLIRDALALQERRGKGDSEHIFPSPRSNAAPIGPGALSHAMADLTAALGLEDIGLHDLRRTGATGMAALGAPPFIVSKVLAHKDAGGGAAVTARHYNLYVYEAEKREALNQWSERLEALFGLKLDGEPGEASN